MRQAGLRARGVFLVAFTAFVLGWLGGGTAGTGLVASAQARDDHGAALVELEERVRQLEKASERFDRRLGFTGLAFLFGAFCALWAQNSRRNPWLWFFLGATFSVVAVLALLYKNSIDKAHFVMTMPPPQSDFPDGPPSASPPPAGGANV